MLISQMIEELEKIKEREGDIQVTCTGFLGPDDPTLLSSGPFETTVENFDIHENNEIGKCVRVYL